MEYSARMVRTPSPILTVLPLLMVSSACSKAPPGPDGGIPVPPGPATSSNIRHLLVIIQENHTFDSYFGRYCSAALGSNPSCENGPSCCEAAPQSDPGTGNPPAALDDQENAAFSPDHTYACEVDEIDGGKMDRFVSSMTCGNARNFAVADMGVAGPYWQLAAAGALADHYFQPVAGQSSSNDMYFARAAYVFRDNSVIPQSVGTRCSLGGKTGEYNDPTIGDLLAQSSVPWAFYAEGYQAMSDANQQQKCPDPPADCAAGVPIYPCVYDPSDVPFQYYPTLRDKPAYMRDFSRLAGDLSGGSLPAVSFIKAIGYKTEHPGLGVTISAGTDFVTGVVAQVKASPYAASTLVLVAYDEGGGYFDHVAPPPQSSVDQQPYGTRLPFLAIGPFARKNHVAHATLEHSSIVKFIEWNWLSGKTGQLHTRDAVVNNLGSLLDPAMTGTAVPEN